MSSSESNLGLDSDSVATAASPFEEEVRNYFVGIAEVMRLPKSIAMIYASVFASSNPLCLDEVKERTGLSKGRVSEGLSFLQRNGFLKEVHYRLNRRTFFEPEMSLRHWLERFMEEAVRPGLNENGCRLEVLQSKCDSDETLARRIEALKVWNAKLGTFLPVLLKAARFATKTRIPPRRSR